MEFERTRRPSIRSLPLVPMIDVMFILIIFFMLTSTFMRIESLSLMLPSVTSQATEKGEVMHLFIKANGDMILGQRELNQPDLNATLTRMFEANPATRVMLLTDDGVTLQQLVGVMDQVYLAGGRSLFVRKWEAPGHNDQSEGVHIMPPK